LGKEPVNEDVAYKGHDWDDVRPHLQTFFQAVRSHKPVTEDAVFGNNAASPATWLTNRISARSQSPGMRRRK